MTASIKKRSVKEVAAKDDAYAAGYGTMNKNVEWMDSKFLLFYIIAHFLAWLTLVVIVFVAQLPEWIPWTFLNVLQTVVSFKMMHWNKGAPIWVPADQGEWDELTFWEQIDNGCQYTLNRKVLTISPIAIFLCASYTSHWQVMPFLFVNLTCLLVCLIPKSPLMHKVRLWGFNS